MLSFPLRQINLFRSGIAEIGRAIETPLALASREPVIHGIRDSRPAWAGIAENYSIDRWQSGPRPLPSTQSPRERTSGRKSQATTPSLTIGFCTVSCRMATAASTSRRSSGCRTDARNISTPIILKTVERIWGYRELRPLQEEAIRAGLEQRDSLVVLPTGGGKSLCYQVPPLIADRTDVVVSPLISLMKDQVDALRANGYPAAAVNSTMSAEEKREVNRQMKRGDLRLLFVAPERLMNDGFLKFLGDAGVRAFAIDEAHCISQWGHDFRPEYRRLAELRQRFPEASFHACTATATQRVREDIIGQLRLREPNVLVGNFDRPNLVYRIVPRVDANTQALEVVRRHVNEAVIIYCISRKDTENLAAYLKAMKINAAAYHAGMTGENRRTVQDDFAQDRLQVVVATVAFGMGIDRSNVRCVIHTAMPKSIEHYQQETGRAGRDGLEAECVMFYSQADVIRWERLIAQSAEEATKPTEVIRAMTELLGEMQRFAAGSACRHRSLVEYFGQAYEKADCAACDVCLNELDTLADATTLAQKIISCVARVGERFGVGHVVDVLLGASTDLIKRCRHDQLSVYGLLRGSEKKELINLTHQLIDQGLLSRTTGERPIVKLSSKSKAALRGEAAVTLVKPAVAGKSRTARFDSESWEGVGRDLFENLRQLRAVIAGERNVPAYVIFGDGTLRDMARRRPGSLEAMRSVWGVGDLKCKDLGPRFLEAIASHCKAMGQETDVAADPPRATGGSKGITAGALASFDLFRKGYSVEKVMETMNRARSTVSGYLAQFIEVEEPESIDQWVTPEQQRLVAEAIRRVGGEHLKPIFEELQGKVEGETIRIVRAHVRNKSG